MTNVPSASCPVLNSHKRLEAAHSYWHDALASYGDPNEFERYINSCIQEMRNFTLLLQKEISGNLDAEKWYSGWQQQFKINPLFSWLNDLRVTVVHLENLKLKSTTKVRIISNYAEAALEVTRGLHGEAIASNNDEDSSLNFYVNPIETLEKVQQEINKRQLPRSIMEQSTASIERTWILDTLPDTELLAALSLCFGSYSKLMIEAHQVFSHEITTCNVSLSLPHPLKPPRMGNDDKCPECMITSRTDRTQRISLKDGSILLGAVEVPVQLTEELNQEILERYGEPILVPENSEKGPLGMVDTILAQAKQIVLSGEVHEWIVILFKGESMDILGPMATDQVDKRAILQGIAEKCAREGADGIIMVGEMWMAPILVQSDGVALTPSKHPERREALYVHAETKSGDIKSVIVPIVRSEGAPTRFEAEFSDSSGINFMDPIRAIWKLS